MRAHPTTRGAEACRFANPIRPQAGAIETTEEPGKRTSVAPWDLTRRLHPKDPARKTGVKVHRKRLLDNGKIEKPGSRFVLSNRTNAESPEKIRAEEPTAKP